MKKLIYCLIIVTLHASCTRNSKKGEDLTTQHNPKQKYIYNPIAVSLNDSAVNLLMQIIPFQDSANAELNRKALKYLNSALEIDSQFQLAYSNKVDVLKSLGRYQEAINTLSHVSSLFGGFAEAYSAQGFLYEKTGKKDSAELMYNLAFGAYQNQIRQEPENVNHRINLAFLLLFTTSKTEALNEIENIIKETNAKQAKDFKAVIKSFDRDQFIRNY